jgi:hypothetical protein
LTVNFRLTVFGVIVCCIVGVNSFCIVTSQALVGFLFI